MKYKVSNCPSFVLMRTATSGTYFDMCGNAKGHIKCADCTDCVIKQVIKVCKEEAVINYPKREKEFITVNGYQAILNMFDIEEINK